MIQDIVKHRIEIEKYKNEVARRIIKNLAGLYPEIKPYILDIDFNNANYMLNQVRSVIDERMAGIKQTLQSNATDFMVYEASFQTKVISTLLDNKKITREFMNKQTASIVFDKAYLINDTFGNTFDNMNYSFKKSITDNVNFAIKNGLTSRDVTSQVRQVMISFTDNNINSLVRTTIQNASTLAAEEAYKDADVEWYQYCAVLDNRTTQICQDLNNTVAKVGEGKIPPQHYNCRSFTIPLDNKKAMELAKNYPEFFKNNNDGSLPEPDAKDGKMYVTSSLTLDNMIKREL